jgi:Phosphopantetheine attachment site
VTADSLPLTPNGKVDRQALISSDAARPSSSAELAAPGSKLERIIAEVWKQALNLEKVGTHDNIFDLGGHSLLLAQIHSRLCEVLKADLPFIKVLEHPTISSLAKYIGRRHGEDSTLKENRDRANKQREVLRRQRRSSGGASGASTTQDTAGDDHTISAKSRGKNDG